MDPEQALRQWGPRLLTIGVTATIFFFLIQMGGEINFLDWLYYVIEPLFNIIFEIGFGMADSEEGCGACFAIIAAICYGIYAVLKWTAHTAKVVLVDVVEAVGIDIDGDGDLSGYDGERQSFGELLDDITKVAEEKTVGTATCLGRRTDGGRCRSKVKQGEYCLYHLDQDPNNPENIARWAAEAKEGEN